MKGERGVCSGEGVWGECIYSQIAMVPLYASSITKGIDVWNQNINALL
jgi:hypothetical protein